MFCKKRTVCEWVESLVSRRAGDFQKWLVFTKRDDGRTLANCESRRLLPLSSPAVAEQADCTDSEQGE